MSNQLKKITLILLSAYCLSTTSVYADQATADALLARINHELDMIKPLINQAEAQAPKNQRTEFHYDWLRQDIGSIQAGISEAINQQSLAPRVITPIKGDYMDTPALVSRESK